MTPKNHLKRSTPSLSLLTLILVCFAFASQMHAVSPAPDGCYPGFTTAEGCNALNSLNTGAGNTAIGWYSLFLNSSGNYNTGVGAGALALNNADSNTGVGTAALLLNTTGFNNTALGTNALVYNDSGHDNNAVGAFALFNNDSGFYNNAHGAFALYNNIDGLRNDAFGDGALFENIHAGGNTAMGDGALQNNDVTGNNLAYDNTAVGVAALALNTDGDSNTAIGSLALVNNDTGAVNTAVGSRALFSNGTGSFNTAVGRRALEANVTGINNTAIGQSAGSDIDGNGNVCIGQGVTGEPGVDGRTYIRNVNTLTQNFSAGVNDYVTVRLSDGRLGHTAVVSSQRYKENIKPLSAASEALYALKPVSFRLKKEYDEAQALGFGLIAEEVEKVHPALVYRNNKDQAESVRYEMVNAMLLNEFLKEHRKVQNQERRIQEQENVIAQLKKEMETVVARLKEQDSKIQRVIDQVEIGKAAPRLVASDQ
jgi:hypothetical protein